MNPRPFSREDLGRAARFFGECNRLTGLRDYMHVGDFLHFLSNGLRGRDPSRHVFVVGAPRTYSELAAVVTFFPVKRVAGVDVSVHPDLRHTGLARELVLWAEEKISREQLRSAAPSGTSPAPSGQDAAEAPEAIEVDVIDCDSAKREVLSGLGYQCADEPHMHYTIRSLSDPIPEPVLPAGFSMRSATGEEEAEALGEVHAASFGSTWGPGEYLKVMRTPGYVADNEIVAVAPDGRFAAFLIYWPDHVSRSGLFEPVGCHKDFRRLGLARALLYEGMRRLRSRGIDVAVVEPLVPAQNPAAYALYESVGFRPRCGWLKYRKTLPA